VRGKILLFPSKLDFTVVKGLLSGAQKLEMVSGLKIFDPGKCLVLRSVGLSQISTARVKKYQGQRRVASYLLWVKSMLRPG